MRKLILVSVFLLAAVSLFAFSFSFGPQKGFFEDLRSDLFSPRTRLGVFYTLKSDPEGNLMRFDKKDGNPGEYYADFKQFNSSKDKMFIQLQAGGSVSGLYFDLDQVEIQGHFEAMIKSVFFLLNGNDVIGFDGSYFGGLEIRLFRSVMIRGGIRHFSGHVGDETLHDLFKNHPEYVNADISEYVRDDFEVSVGYDSDAFPYFRCAFSFIIPQKKSYMLPFFSRPDYIVSGTSNNQQRDPDSYAIRGDYGPAYKAIILAGETMFSYPFGKNEAFLSLQGKLHQDGWTNLTLTPDDDSRKWDLEYDVSLGIQRSDNGRSVSFEVIWHSGRFPLLNYYWKKADSLSVVFSVR